MLRITRGFIAIIFAVAMCCGPHLAEYDSDDGELDDLDDLASTTDQALNAAYLDAEESAFLNLINDYRKSIGVGKLRASIGLTRASDAHSTDMANTGVLKHESSDGTGTFVRI